MKRRSLFGALTALVLPAVAAPPKAVIGTFPSKGINSTPIASAEEQVYVHTHCVTDPGHTHGMLPEEHATPPRPGWRYVTAETRPDGTVHFYPFPPLKE